MIAITKECGYMMPSFMTTSLSNGNPNILCSIVTQGLQNSCTVQILGNSLGWLLIKQP